MIRCDKTMLHPRYHFWGQISQKGQFLQIECCKVAQKVKVVGVWYRACKNANILMLIALDFALC